MPKYSIIVPLFNRSGEIDELLNSFTKQTYKDFEMIIVEDGSTEPAREVVESYRDDLLIQYVFKSNGGPADSRNYGVRYASGEYVIFLDSDCIAPPSYLSSVEQGLNEQGCEVFGGPDKAHPSFSPIQKAINYSMTSFFTTGGIRGGKKKLDRFYPRSFNMGMKLEVFELLGGFSNMRFGEDIDFSIRLYKANCLVRLFDDAWVYHKRRVDFYKFYRQVYNFGLARINLYKRHPESLKAVHFLPAFFTIGVIDLLLTIPFSSLALLPILFFASIIYVDSFIKNKNVGVAFLSILASFIQLIGYGFGFITGVIMRMVMRRGEFSSFKNTFYK